MSKSSKESKMRMKNTLGKIVLASTIGLGLSGCSNPEYHFDGMIGEDKVKFYEKRFGSREYLEVSKPDGRKIIYERYNDFMGVRIDSVEITSKGITKEWNGNDPIGKEVLKIAETQFDNYLGRILEINKEKALKGLK